MGMKRSLCHKHRRFRVVAIDWLFVSLTLIGCGGETKSVSRSREAQPLRNSPAVANDRYEQVQVTIDGKPMDADTTITVGRDFEVTVSFRRLHTWSDLDNSESMIEAIIMEQYRELTLTRRYPTLTWQSEKNGVLTYAGTVESLAEHGVFSFKIEETVTTEMPGIQRYVLFATNLRSVKR